MNSQSPGIRDRDAIPWPVYLKRIVFQLCFYPVFTVVVGSLVVAFVPQVRETMIAFGDERRFSSQGIWFGVALIVWMLAAWYVARLLLSRVFKPDLIGPCRSRVAAIRISKYLPRVLAAIAAAPVIFATFFGQLTGGMIALICIAAASVMFFIIFRRKFGVTLEHPASVAVGDSDHFGAFTKLHVGSVILLVTILLVSFVLLLLILFMMEDFARPIGSPALVLLALASWTVFGGVTLTYLPRAYGWPALNWLPVAFVLIFAFWNENHPVDAPASAAASAAEPVSRPGLNELLYDWQQERADKSAPIIFVATAGGASRAAYWTSSALGKLEDDARAESKAFADNIFLISSVSGGSVGAASFVATLNVISSNEVSDPDCMSIRKHANAFTGNDHLATVVGFLLYPDLFQRLIPGKFKFFDRSRALEEVWVRDWQRLLDRCGRSGVGNPWANDFLALHGPGGANFPALVMNTTALGSGKPAMQANFLLDRSGAFDVFAEDLSTRGLTLSQVAHNSARFPYVSPAGVVNNTSGKVWDRLGDGGYVESSGTLMLGDAIRDLLRDGAICRRPDEYSCPAGDVPCRKCIAQVDQLRVLILDNTPAAEGDWLCSVGKGPSPGARRAEHVHNFVTDVHGKLYAADVFAPFVGAFATRGGRAASAEIDVLRLAGGCNGDRYAELRLPRSELRRPAMNWMLNQASRAQIDGILDDPSAHPRLKENLEIARSWFR